MDGGLITLLAGPCWSTIPAVACGVKESSAAAAAPLAQTLPWSAAGGPVAVPAGLAIESESDTIGIRLFTSALVTSVRWASAIDCAGLAA